MPVADGNEALLVALAQHLDLLLQLVDILVAQANQLSLPDSGLIQYFKQQFVPLYCVIVQVFERHLINITLWNELHQVFRLPQILDAEHRRLVHLSLPLTILVERLQSGDHPVDAAVREAPVLQRHQERLDHWR